MKLSSFKYDISPDLIAQNPLDNRDDSRLMVVDKDKGTIEHKMFKDVLDE
jgi:S-adenosylmethionine:tRNA ribosyltransferase-isomerase